MSDNLSISCQNYKFPKKDSLLFISNLTKLLHTNTKDEIGGVELLKLIGEALDGKSGGSTRRRTMNGGDFVYWLVACFLKDTILDEPSKKAQQAEPELSSRMGGKKSK